MSEYITTEEAASILKLTSSRVRQLVRSEILRAVKFGRDWQVERQSVEEYARRRKN
jgi:excisionase family DNA binding protein